MQVMLDLETLSTEPNAAIVAIGAAKFDAAGVHSKFYVCIDPTDSERYGRHISASTVQWWMHSDRDVARDQAFLQDNIDLYSALDGFSQWFGAESMPVWGNGAGFDNVLLSSSYKAVGFDQPWKFWDDRCYRTIKNLAPSIELERVGTYHNAVDDAESQALHLIKIAGHLGFAL